MSGFSIDDILAEVDKKRKGDDKDAELIIKKKPAVDLKIEAGESAYSNIDIGVTDILNEKELLEAMNRKPQRAAEETRQSKEKSKKFKNINTEALKNEFQPESRQKAYNPALELTSEIPEEKPLKRVREKKPKSQFDTGDIFFKKAKVLPKPVMEEQPQIKSATKHELEKNEATIQSPEQKESFVFKDEELSVKANRGASLSIGGNIADGDEEKILDPVSEALKKRGEYLLERDFSLDNPLDQIDALNPYDMLPETEPAEVISVEKNIDFLEEDKSQRFVSLLSGDTNGIADGDLKRLAGKTAEKQKPESTAEVKTYIPNIQNAQITEADASSGILNEKARRSNTALIDSLNKALKAKRDSDISAYRTLQVDDEGGEKNPVKPVTHGLNINYKKQIVTDTALIMHGDPKSIEQKINDLASKRKRKIRDFVLEDVEDEKEPVEQSESQEEEDEFADYDTSGQIWNDLCETHKGLKIRFIILLFITGLSCLLSFVNDSNFFRDNGIEGYNILGIDTYFMNKSADPKGFLYFNLILGVVGILACSNVIKGGLTRLFTGKADCDSLCSIPAVVSVLSTVPMLNGTGFYQQGFTNIFISAGLFGLFFNTAGKLIMMSKTKRNFKFISGDNPKYYAQIVKDEPAVRSFTKGVMPELPVLCAMRKTEFLTDFLKNSYCNDKADQLCRYITPAALGAALIVGIGSMLLPYENAQLRGNIFWALTTSNAVLSLLSPISIMFLVNFPLLRASKAMSKNDGVVLGYNAAENFSKVNSILVDASSLFPAGSVDFRTLKRCQPADSSNSFAIDEAIITAASLAIKSGSALTPMFYDMIAGKSELLYNIENCIYEVNMGISGWIGNKRVMFGNRDQMKHHGIKVPPIKKEQQYSGKFGDVVYLACAGETIAMFFLKIVPNPQIKKSLQELQKQGISIIVRTRDSIITSNSLAEAFELAPENLKVISFDLHAKFDECIKYSSRGDGGISCSGTFSSFASGLSVAKKIMHNIILSSSSLFTGMFLSVIFVLIFTIFADTDVFTSTNIILYNGFFFMLMMLMQGFKKY